MTPKPFVRTQFPPKIRSVSSRAVLAEFARTHTFCQMCGRDGEMTLHHIIGGRGGRSDETCNLLACCARPCHLDFADHACNLGVVLAMKLRAGELSEADLDRLQVLHGKRLPDLEPIPEPFASSYEHNARMRRAA